MLDHWALLKWKHLLFPLPLPGRDKLYLKRDPYKTKDDLEREKLLVTKNERTVFSSCFFYTNAKHSIEI